MRNNKELAQDVAEAIQWDPLMKGTKIHVSAHDSIITLTGAVDGFLKKVKAEEIARSVVGVKAVVEHIELKLKNDDEISDEQIALAIINALKSDVQVPHDRLTVRVENGRVTLEGDLAWNFQKQAAAADIRPIEGIKVFSNAVRILPDSKDEIEHQAIQRALWRSSAMDDQDIHVYVKDNHVTLDGVVSSYFQKEEAERIAWNAPGIVTLTNKLSIDLRD